MIEFGAFSYITASVFYAILFILLVTSWRGRLIGVCLVAACIISMFWGAVLASQIMGNSVPYIAVFLAEVLRGGAWLTFLVVLALRIGVNRYVCYLSLFVWAGILVTGVVLSIGADYFPSIVEPTSILIPGGLVISFVGLVLIEQVYRNATPESRRALKTLAIGLGGLFAYDLFLYSQGVLFNTLDQSTWLARGAVNIFFVPLIAVAARRNSDWDLNIFVSRQVVFYSTSLIAVGVYLVLMALGGYMLVIYGGSWGGLARTVFFVGAGLVLVTLLFSGTLRARAKVFLSKHFFQNKYDYREEWLRLVATLAGFEDSSTRQLVIKAMAQIVQSPGGMLWILDERQGLFQMVASYELTHEAFDITTADSLVEFIRKDGWLVDLAEYQRTPEKYSGLTLPTWLQDFVGAWLVVPLITRQELLGLVILIEAPGRPVLNYEDRDLLKTVGGHIAVHLAQEKSDNLLAEAQQFEAYNRLTAFLMHDLNNLVAQQTLIVKNAEKHKRNPDFVDDAMHTIANSVARMKSVLDQLKRSKKGRVRRVTNVNSIVEAAVERCGAQKPVPTLDLSDDGAVLDVEAEQFTMVVTHLIRNAQDATSAEGSVSVSARQVNGVVVVTITDTGQGMTSGFVRDRLFRPFDSTKGSQGMGIGAYQAREFARSMGGDVAVQSEVSKGTTITLSVPVPVP
jgi:putative PEP-CTERM system histidine kinase